MTEYNDEEYLKLFKQVNENKDDEETPMLKETPNYSGLPNLNETPDTSKYRVDENVNDGWNMQFQTETRVNGVKQQSNNPYQQTHRSRGGGLKNDPNGLGQYIDDDDVNEVYRQPKVQRPIQQPQQPIQQVQPVVEKLNEFKEVDVVSVELFERWNEAYFINFAQTENFQKLIINNEKFNQV